jgi:hypothetical protein
MLAWIARLFVPIAILRPLLKRWSIVDAVPNRRDNPSVCLVALRHRAFLIGENLGLYVIDADAVRHVLAVVQLSPVSMTTRMPSALRPLIASGVVAFTMSAIARTPAIDPSTAVKIAVAPSLPCP